MALQAETKAVPLFGGIDTKTDTKYVSWDKSLTAQNVQFYGVNRARKRYGQTALSTKVANENRNITTGKAIGTFKNEILIYDGNEVFAYGEGQGKWTSKGALTEVNLSATAIVRSSGSVSGIASISMNDAEIYAWEDSRGGVYYCVRDVISGTMVVPNTALPAGSSSPQLVASGASTYLFYIWSGVIYAAKFLNANLSAGVVQLNLLTGAMATGGLFAVTSYSDYGYGDSILLMYPTSTTAWAGQAYNTGLTPTLTVTTSALSAAIGAKPGLFVQRNNAGVDLALLSVADTTNSVVRLMWIVAPGGFTGSAVTSIAATGTQTAVSCGISSSLQFRLFWDSGGGTSMPALHAVDIDVSGSAPALSGTTSTQFGLAIASQPVPVNFQVRPVSVTTPLLPTIQPYIVATSPLINLAAETSQQSAFYLCDQNGAILQRFLGESAFLGGTVVPRIQELNDGRLFLGVAERTSLRADATGTVYTVSGLTAAYFTFPDKSNFKVVQFGTTGVIACGNTYTYDGSVIVESGFWEFPDGITAVDALGGQLNPGIYNYCVTYEWADSAGNTHYSAPSYPIQVGTVTAPIPALSQVTLTIPYTALTRKVGTTVNVYRTATAPGVPATTATGLGPWFKIASVANLVDGTASFTYNDQASDASLQGNQFLYAPPDGTGELENFAPPPFALMVATKTRVFGFAQDDPTALWYSKPLAPGRPAEFTPFQVVRVESDGGLPTALSYIDAQAVIFKARRVYFLPGDGPNAGGGGTFFPAPQLISTTSGCISQPSVLPTHDGVFFKSQIGLQVLNRSLTVQPQVGLPVQGFNSLSLTGAVAAPDQNQFRWASSNGTALIFDYTSQRWCTYTGYAAVGYTQWGDTYARLRADGTVLYEDQSTYLDDGEVVQMKVETSWLKPAQMAQGYACVWYAQVLGEFIDPHTLTVEVAYDYTDVVAQTNVWTTAGNINTSTFGSSAAFGSDVVFGSNVLSPSTNYQLRIALQRQTCESVKFTIYDSSITGASCDLNEIGLQLGVIGGLNRTTPGRQV